MTEYIEEYKGYLLRIWTEDRGLFGGEYTIEGINKVWHECGLGTLLALFHEAVENKTMNWQTKEVQDWLDEAGILNSQRENAAKLESLVENLLLEEFDGSATNILKRQITLYFLGKVQWGELVINPNAWDDYEYKEDVS